jgi:hypothetical protein
VRDILAAAGEEIVEANDDRTTRDQTVAKVRTNETRTPGHECDPLLKLHKRLPVSSGEKRLPPRSVPWP